MTPSDRARQSDGSSATGAASLEPGAPGDELGRATLYARARAGMRAIGLDGPDWQATLADWTCRLEAECWFDAPDSNVARLDAVDGAAIRVADDRALAAGVALPAWDPTAASPPAPIYLDGFCPPWLLLRILNAYPKGELGPWARICVVERDPHAVLDALAHLDAPGWLTEERIAWFLGPDAHERLAQFLGDRAAYATAGTVISTPGVSDGAELAAVVQQAVNNQQARMRTVVSGLAAKLAGRDARWWAGRYAEAIDGSGDPLRVIVMTSRFSSYVGAAAGDIATALDAHGAQATVLEEPDDSTSLTSLAVAEEIQRRDADLVITLNHPRGLVARSVPDGVPFACWVQDPMPHLFTEQNARPGPLDFFLGHQYPAMAGLGLPIDRLLVCPVLASERKFLRPDEPPADIAWDIAIVSNHGEPPASLAQRTCAGYGLPEAMTAQILDATRSIEELAQQPMDAVLAPALEEMGCAITGDRSGSHEGPAAKITRHVLLPIAERAARHAAFGWAATLAERRGWSIALVGRGWRDHPALGRFAHGVAEHGDELRTIYQRSAVTLHASAGWPLHQRVLECALAGGLPGVMVKAGDCDTLQKLASEALSHAGPPTATHVRSRSLRASCLDHPAGLWATAQLQRLAPRLGAPIPSAGLGGGGFIGRYPWHAAPAGGERRPRLAPHSDELTLFGDLAEIGFWDRASLEELVTRAREDRGWRTGCSRWIRDRARASFTYERAAGAIPSFIADGLTRAAEASRRLERAPA